MTLKLVTAWSMWYCVTLLLLAVTEPATSHSDNWAGVPQAIILVILGAYHLSQLGARASTCFIYGCGSKLLFLLRFLGMDRFGLWLEYQGPSNVTLGVLWIVLSLLLGGVCASVATAAATNRDERTQ